MSTTGRTSWPIDTSGWSRCDPHDFGGCAFTATPISTGAALAYRLAATGVGTERIVAVAPERSAGPSLALVAIPRAGAVWTSFNPEHSPERIARVRAMARPVALLISGNLAGLVPAGARGLGAAASRAGCSTFAPRATMPGASIRSTCRSCMCR
ncbi:hypothetical protein D2T33_20355 [Sinirhodobacter populi]|uniref:AMP-dependent synthetase/ligase domain-containing protein n=1 Tax=Paenirhodobacter populi TaxID=2306993 RepID=A0A443IK92_9RHOB|nr:hypothetical protein D2T33_20355 [Sinirhodobacter populi]